MTEPPRPAELLVLPRHAEMSHRVGVVRSSGGSSEDCSRWGATLPGTEQWGRSGQECTVFPGSLQDAKAWQEFDTGF